jgi:hypothetical protein
MLELTHHSFIAYPLPATGEVVPMPQVAPSKTDAERLLLVSPELAEVLTAIIFVADACGPAYHRTSPRICGHALLDTTMGYAAIYPEDVISQEGWLGRLNRDEPQAPLQVLSDIRRGCEHLVGGEHGVVDVTPPVFPESADSSSCSGEWPRVTLGNICYGLT